MNIHSNVDEENLHKGALTEPKKRSINVLTAKSHRAPLVPLSVIITENGINSHNNSEKHSLSEPINTSKTRSRIIQNVEKIDIVKTTKKKQLEISVENLAKILEYDTFIEEELGTNEIDEIKMFKFLEKEGRLSQEILKIFSKCPNIRSVNMTNSYAGIVGESGLLSEAKYASVLCTKPFYNGFQQLLSIDFTNIKIQDNELRYLIRLPKLQAIGLSGTSITDKGIKYISIHSAFIKNLKCLKLCYVQGISDQGIKFLNSFAKLKNLDLRGCEKITLKGCLDLVEEIPTRSNPELIAKLPQKIQNQLNEQHNFYIELSKQHINLILDPKDVRIENLSESELRSQLKFHKKMYINVYLNEGKDALRKNLISILRVRKKEEILLSYCFN